MSAIGALMVLGCASQLPAQTLYWDANGTGTTGAGATPTGTWNTGGGAASSRWNTESDGLGGSIGKWVQDRDAVFSAGTNAINAFTVTVSGTMRVSSITVEEGSPTFSSGTAINFSDASPDFIVGSGLTTTVNTNITGTNGLTKLGDGTLIFGTNDKTYSGTTTISAGVLQLDFDQSFSTVDLAGGTLRLSSASSTITTLNVTQDSFLDFAGAASTLNLTTLNLSAGVTLTIQNWVNAADYFITQNWTGASFDTTNSAPMNQVRFSGFNASDTKWQAYDNQITPVPEPSAYGAVLLGLGGTLMAWRRRRRS